MTVDILLQREPIVLKTEVPPEAGAVVRFEGRVRAAEQGRTVKVRHHLGGVGGRPIGQGVGIGGARLREGRAGHERQTEGDTP